MIACNASPLVTLLTRTFHTQQLTGPVCPCKVNIFILFCFMKHIINFV